MDYVYETTETLAISNDELLSAMFETGLVNPIANTDGSLYTESDNVVYVL
jgi:hypothetical protein